MSKETHVLVTYGQKTMAVTDQPDEDLINNAEAFGGEFGGSGTVIATGDRDLSFYFIDPNDADAFVGYCSDRAAGECELADGTFDLAWPDLTVETFEEED